MLKRLAELYRILYCIVESSGAELYKVKLKLKFMDYTVHNTVSVVDPNPEPESGSVFKILIRMLIHTCKIRIK